MINLYDVALNAAHKRALRIIRRTPEERRADLARLREGITAKGIIASSPDRLSPEGEQLARQERED